MNNIKTSILTWIFIGCGLFSWSQVTVDASALELTKLLHKTKVEHAVQLQSTVIIDSTSTDLNTKEQTELYKSISKKYQQRFKPTELNELIVFYKSPIGKKLRKEYPKMMADANSIISKWEMKQLGIEEISIDEVPALSNEEELVVEVTDTIIPQPKVKPIIKEVVIVKSLQQLKVLLKKAPNLIYDPIELSKILNISLEQEAINEPESILSPEIKNNKTSKN